MAVSPSRSLPPLSHRRSVHSGSSDLLQNKLRQLLVCDSAEELSVEQLGPLSPPAEYAQRCHKSLPDLHCRAEPSSNKSSNKSLSNRDSGGSSGHYTQRSEPAPPPRQVNIDFFYRHKNSEVINDYFCVVSRSKKRFRIKHTAQRGFIVLLLRGRRLSHSCDLPATSTAASTAITIAPAVDVQATEVPAVQARPANPALQVGYQ